MKKNGTAFCSVKPLNTRFLNKITMYHIVPNTENVHTQSSENVEVLKKRPSQKMGQKTSQKMGQAIIGNCLI